ncbi:MAG: acyl-ACP desaturase, partial [Mycobacteriaceae bacterium]
QVSLPKAQVDALAIVLLTKDNLPAYHRELVHHFTLEGQWGQWIGRWTGEENQHAIVIRDYLMVTRNIDPVALEQTRMQHMVQGYRPLGFSGLETLVFAALHERALSVLLGQIRQVTADPILRNILDLVLGDEDLHFQFFSELVKFGLSRWPNGMMQAINARVHGCELVGASIVGYADRLQAVATSGIYGAQVHHKSVLKYAVNQWDVFVRNDLDLVGRAAQAELSTFLAV